VGGTIETKTELSTPPNSAGNAKMPPRAPEFTPQQQVRKKTVEEFSKVDADLAKQLDNTQRIDGAAGYISERHNNHGPAVKFWQEHLKEWAISQGGAVAEKFKNMVVTDSFASNPLFNELIKTFQRIMNVPGGADGVIGPRTFRVLALGHFDASYGEGAFTKYTSVSILSEEEYKKILVASFLGNGGYSAVLPLPEAIEAKTILKNPQKLAAFRALMNRYSNGRPALPAEKFLELCDEYNFDPTLALAQAIQESNIGTQGRAVETHNIFNVGNVNSGANNPQGDFETGMRTYLSLMTRRYGNNAEGCINRSFMRTDGQGAYCTLDNGQPDPNYPQIIRSFVGTIRKELGAEVNYEAFYKEQGGLIGILLGYHQAVDHLRYQLGGQRWGGSGIDCSEYAVGFLKRAGCNMNGIPDTDTLKTLGNKNGLENFAYNGPQDLRIGDVIVWGDKKDHTGKTIKEGHTGIVGPNDIMFESTSNRSESGPQARRGIEAFVARATGREVRVLRPIVDVRP
jgi:hypothetical protein